MMDLFRNLLALIRDPGVAIATGGYVALAIIVFAETGLMVFFLPGDSLLVTAGVYAARGTLSIWLLNALLIPAAVLGPIVSYWIGAKAGPRLFSKPRSRFFRPEYLKAAHDFYEKHGVAAIIIARFMPLVRTFVPVVAGVARMPYGRYTLYNLIGAAAWVLSMTLIGYFLGNTFPAVREHMDAVIIIVVVLSLLPGLISFLRARRQKKVAPDV